MFETHQIHRNIGYCEIVFLHGDMNGSVFCVAWMKSVRVSTLNKITLHCGHSDSFCLDKNPSVCGYETITKPHRVEKLLEREHELSQLSISLEMMGLLYIISLKYQGEGRNTAYPYTCTRSILFRQCFVHMQKKAG